MIIHDTIKSLRVYSEGGYLRLDIRVQPGIRLPAKYSNNRIRCSTGKIDTAVNRKYVDKYKFELALKHLEPLLASHKIDGNVTFGDIAYAALEEAVSNRRKQDGTKEYQRILEKDVMPYFGGMKISEIRPADIKLFQAEQGKRGLSQSSYNKKHFVLKRVMDHAQENGYIVSNPIDAIKRSSKQFVKARSLENNYFTEREREIILSAPFEGNNERKRRQHEFLIAFLYVAFFSGARTGEIMALKWSDINFTDNTITICRSIRKGVESTTKTDQARVVPMIDRLVEVLKQWRQVSKGDYVFPVPNKGTPYRESRAIADHMYKPLLERLGIPYKILYCTRSTFASLAVEKGVGMPTVSRCLGHSNIATTQRFYIRMGNLDVEVSRSELQSLAG